MQIIVHTCVDFGSVCPINQGASDFTTLHL